MCINKRNFGFTLIEITVVLLILIALAGLAVPYISGTSSKAICDATDVTMQNVKKAIMERYYLDTLGHFPVSYDTTNHQANTDYNLKYLFTKGGWQDFDLNSQTGWRGAYLQGGVNLDSSAVIYKKANLSNTFTNTSLGFVNSALADGDAIILDGWGRPIILQVSTCASWNTVASETTCARLVSAGKGNGLGIGEAGIETPIAGNRPVNPNGTPASDDRILYLNAPTPSRDINLPCDEN